MDGNRLDRLGARRSRGVGRLMVIGGLGRQNGHSNSLCADSVCLSLILRDSVDSHCRRWGTLSGLGRMRGRSVRNRSLAWVNEDCCSVDDWVVGRCQVGRIIRLGTVVAHRSGVRHPGVSRLCNGLRDVIRDHVGDRCRGRVVRGRGSRLGAMAVANTGGVARFRSTMRRVGIARFGTARRVGVASVRRGHDSGAIASVRLGACIQVTRYAGRAITWDTRRTGSVIAVASRRTGRVITVNRR